jgi:hypothetical protein
MSQYGFFALPQSPQGQDGTGASRPFCEDFNETEACGFSGSTRTGFAAGVCTEANGNCNGCNNNNSVANIPGDPSADPTAATVSTVCGNGIIELFEDCDFNATTGNPAGCVCSSTCRCSGGAF